MFYKKIILNYFIIITICICSLSSIYAYDVILGGHSIGIELNYNGVLIKGMYDIKDGNKIINQKDYGFKENDLIIKINNKDVNTINELSHYIEQYIDENNDIILTIQRDNQYLKKKLIIINNGESYSTGLYVKDGINGIGTITYYDENTKQFGALGHIMSEDNNITCQNGKIYYSKITNIIPSKKYNPGEKLGIRESDYIGTINENNISGLYGYYYNVPENSISIEISSKEEVKKGEAYFLTVLDNNKPIKCKIKILSIDKESNIKNFTFEVIDKDVLDKTSGIIQGMSGSPIIQNGKLIGAVTHVIVNNPTKGHGIFIENMLENEY